MEKYILLITDSETMGLVHFSEHPDLSDCFGVIEALADKQPKGQTGLQGNVFMHRVKTDGQLDKLNHWNGWDNN